MLDLKSILVDTRQYLLNEFDGLPAAFTETQNKAALINALQKIVEGEPPENHSDSEDLGFLSVYLKSKNDKITTFFSRLLILKFLYEETLKDNSLEIDKQWFKQTRENLHTEYKSLDTPLEINGKKINTLADLEELREQSRHQIQRYPITAAVLVTAAVVFTYLKMAGNRNPYISLALLAGSLYTCYVEHKASQARATLFAARNAEQRLQQPNNDFMENESIKKFFLLSNEELSKLNKGPKLN